jgi:vancomycin permeability regulator SanA
LLFSGAVLSGTLAVWLANVWIRNAAAPYLYTAIDDVPEREVAIVPGARVHEDGRPYPVLEDRLELARGLYERGKVERILVSGAANEPEGMRDWLVAHGVPAEAIATDPRGLRTLDTMRRASHEHGATSAIVCTQEFHLARAVWLARQSGIDAVGVRADRRRYPRHAQWLVREALARARAFVDVYALPGS